MAVTVRLVLIRYQLLLSQRRHRDQTGEILIKTLLADLFNPSEACRNVQQLDDHVQSSSPTSVSDYVTTFTHVVRIAETPRTTASDAVSHCPKTLAIGCCHAEKRPDFNAVRP